MVGVPALIPFTVPDIEPIVASAVLLLVHTPGVDAFDSVVDEPTQTFNVPVIGNGNGLTVTGIIDEQPPGNV